MPRKLGVDYIKPAEPSFLRRFKEETGYQEYSVDDKNKKLDKDNVCFTLHT